MLHTLFLRLCLLGGLAIAAILTRCAGALGVLVGCREDVLGDFIREWWWLAAHGSGLLPRCKYATSVSPLILFFMLLLRIIRQVVRMLCDAAFSAMVVVK